MQIILASAKIMNDRTTVKVPYTSVPVFEKDAERSAMELAQIPVDELSKVLHCSHAIALENHNRYQSFLNEDEKQPAVLAYFGQAYKYLEAKDFSNDDFDFAQKHLHILSFLYGMLRPLDTIHPYRLEGKVRRKRLGITVFQPRLKVCTFARTNYYEYGKQRQVQESP